MTPLTFMAKAIVLESEDVHNRGSLLTHFVGGNETCVGYLFMHEGRAYSPNGLVKGLTKEEVETHNKCLSEAELGGLDQNCQVGQGTNFYCVPPYKAVKTWHGDTVSIDVTRTNKTVTFRRNGMVFRGRIPADSDAVFFKRIS